MNSLLNKNYYNDIVFLQAKSYTHRTVNFELIAIGDTASNLLLPYRCFAYQQKKI